MSKTHDANVALVRAAILEALDGKPWLFWDEDEDLANAQRVDFADRVVAWVVRQPEFVQKRAAVTAERLSAPSTVGRSETKWGLVADKLTAILANEHLTEDEHDAIAAAVNYLDECDGEHRHAKQSPSSTATCGCRESYPQLVQGKVSHGPGCQLVGVASSSIAASNLMVTKGDGLPLPDQASALDEFKLQCRLGAMYRLLQAIVDSDNQQSRSKNADMLAKDIADVARAPRVAPSATPAASSIGGKDGRCPTCLNALTPGAHSLLTQIQDDRAILALIEEVEALRRGVGVTHGDGNDPAMLLKRVVGTREDIDRREAIYREAVAHEKSLPAPADAEAKAFGEGILAAADEVAKHWNDGTTMVNQRAQAMRSAEALRSLPIARSATPAASSIGRKMPICEAHRSGELEWPDLSEADDACAACRICYLEAQESLLEEWQQRAKRAEESLAEVQRPLDAQMARLNATVVQLNEENERLRQSLSSARGENK